MRAGPLLFLLIALPFALAYGWDAAHSYMLPDALWGGDSYAQLGIATSIYNGASPWEDAHFEGEWAFRDWLPYLLLAGSARLVGASPHAVARFWPVLVMIVGGLVVYFLARRLHRSEPIALLAGAAWMGIQTTLLPTSRYFAAMLMVPLAVLALAYAGGSLRSRLLAGAAIGLAALSYLVAFFGLLMLLGLASVVRIARREATPREELRFVSPIWLVALPIVLLLWGPILVVYGGDTLNPAHLYGDGARGWTFAQSLEPLSALFLDTTNPVRLILSLGALVGVFAAFRQSDARGGRWALLLTLVGLLGTYHWLVTLPLFGDHLVYYRWPTVFLRLAQTLLALQALHMAIDRLPRGAPRAWPRPTALALVALLLAAGSVQGSYRDVDPAWRGAARDVLETQDMQVVLAMANWTNENTRPEDVVLGVPLDSFALHALTGRKLVVERRPHANTFVDMDQRYADAAVMLFGQDEAQADALLDAYSVDFVVAGPLFREFLATDPLLTSPLHAPAWDAAGIPYERTKRPYDPIGEGQLFDVIVPTNVTFGAAIVDLPIVWSGRGESGDAFILARS